jgi:hypothetical protein
MKHTGRDIAETGELVYGDNLTQTWGIEYNYIHNKNMYLKIGSIRVGLKKTNLPMEKNSTLR